MSWTPEAPKTPPRLSREEKAARTRAALLDSARRVFALKGYEAATVDEIAAAAGFTRGAFYSHFPNKQAVMEEIIDGGFESDIDALSPIATAGDVESMKDEYQRYSRRFVDNPESLLWALEFQLAALRHPELRRSYEEQYDRIRAQVGRMVTGVARAKGHPRPEEAEPLAEAFIVLQTGLGVRRLLHPERVPDDVFARAFAALAAGLGAQAGGPES